MTDTSTRICLWCSTPIPAEAAACPKCGAAVEGATAREIPGVTVPDPGASLFADEGLLRAAPIAEEAILPPSEAVRLEMRKMQLEAEIAGPQVDGHASSPVSVGSAGPPAGCGSEPGP